MYRKRRRFEGTSLRKDLFTRNFGSGVICGDFAKMRGVSRWTSQSKTKSANCPNFLKDKNDEMQINSKPWSPHQHHFIYKI